MITCSAFGDATVRQVMDMTTSLRFSEVYADPKAEIWSFARTAGVMPKPPGYAGPATSYEFFAGMAKEPGREHGAGFTYKSPNTEVLGWLIRRVTGQRFEKVLSDRLWAPLGMEHDGYMQVDSGGAPLASRGSQPAAARPRALLRDDAPGRAIQWPAGRAGVCRGRHRAGRQQGGFRRRRLQDAAWLEYHNQWWVSHNDHGAYSARGVYGQLCYVDPKAQMAIVRFAWFPLAANANLDPTSLPAYHALANHLMANPR